MKPSPSLHLALLAVSLGLLASSCSTTSGVSEKLKAKPVELSSFIEHRAGMKPQRHRSPFALSWVNPSLSSRRLTYQSIWIAPVDTSHLRAARTNLSNVTGIGSKQRPVREMAGLIRQSFVEAFKRSPSPRLKLDQLPSNGGVTLQLALVELNPTDTAGNAVKTAVPYGGVLSPLMNGNIAIEGQVRDNRSHEILFEFADNERDQMTVASLRDFSPYEHAKAAIRDWARQFEELTRTPPSHKVEDSLFFTLNPL